MTLKKLFLIFFLFVGICICSKDDGILSGAERRERLKSANTRKIGTTDFSGKNFIQDPFVDDNDSPPQRSLDTHKSLKENGGFLEVDSDGNVYETILDDDLIDLFQEIDIQQVVEYTIGSNGPDEEDNNEDDDDEKRRLRILGADTRYELSGNPITSTPSKWVGLLTFSAGSCSASLIGPRHILTAGHCVHEGNGGNWYGNFKFYPGRNRYDTSTAYSWSRARTFTGWTQNGNFDWDIAIIELSTSPNRGYLSFSYNNNLPISTFYHRGYSGDKPYGTLWGTYDTIWQLTTHQIRTDDSDTYYGNSGGPWYKYVSGIGWEAYAAHSHWGLSGSTYYNSGTRFTQTKYDSFCNFINDCSVCSC